MTFTEAAAHVLRLVGKPLHYKEITDVAIERDLLSHVGKSPEVTMGARLAAVVKKDPKDNPLVRVKPGVFALRDWDQSVIDSGLADRTPALERLAKMDLTRESSGAVEPAQASLAPDGEEEAELDQSGYPDLGALDPDDEEDIGDDERARAELAAAATELFVPEEDDDEPILGGDLETDAAERAPAEGGGKRRRRRRRRGGRSGGDEDTGLPSYTVSDAPLLTEVAEEDSSPASSDPGRRQLPLELREAVRGDREREGRERSPDSRSGERAAESRAAAEGRPGDNGRVVEDLRVPAMLTLLEQLLPPRSRGGAIPLRQLAEQGLRRVRGKVEVQQLQDALADAVRSEVVRARAERRRQRYVLHGRAVASTDWGLDPEVLRLEKELLATAARHREAFQHSLGERLQSLPPRALSDLFTLLLGQLGFEEVQPVKRQGMHNQELHFSAIARSPGGDRPTAIILRRDGRDIGRERVIDLRGSLHHYAGAQAGLLVTTGQVLSGAREEAAVPNAAPVALMDGVTLARLCAQHGVGVAFTELRVPMVDIELMDSLAAN